MHTPTQQTPIHVVDSPRGQILRAVASACFGITLLLCVPLQAVAEPATLTETLLTVTIQDPSNGKAAASIPVLSLYPANSQTLPVVLLVRGQAAEPESRQLSATQFQAQFHSAPGSLKPLAQWLAAQGIAVVIPASIQPGLGTSSASTPPVASASTRPAPTDCSPAGIAASAAHGASQLFAVADLLRQQSWADPRRVLVLSEGASTLASLNAAALRWPGLRGIVASSADISPVPSNPATPSPPAAAPRTGCAPSAWQPALTQLGGKVRVPSLWLHGSANDAPDTTSGTTRDSGSASALFRSFVQAGGPAEFRAAPLPPIAPGSRPASTSPLGWLSLAAAQASADPTSATSSALPLLTAFLARSGLIRTPSVQPAALDLPSAPRPSSAPASLATDSPQTAPPHASALADLSGDRLPPAPRPIGMPDAPKPLSPLLAPSGASSADSATPAVRPSRSSGIDAVATQPPPTQSPPPRASAALSLAAIEQRMPFVAAPERTALWQRYQRLTSPRALAFSPSGAWGLGSGAQARLEALTACERASGQPCQIFALDDQIVWKP